jgi:hypothetical protein
MAEDIRLHAARRSILARNAAIIKLKDEIQGLKDQVRDLKEELRVVSLDNDHNKAAADSQKRYVRETQHLNDSLMQELEQERLKSQKFFLEVKRIRDEFKREIETRTDRILSNK